MRIVDEIQLDFSDVLLKPSRSRLNSRKDVNPLRTYDKFRWYRGKVVSSGIIVANMGTTGSFRMAESVSQYGTMTALRRDYKVEDYRKQIEAWAKTGDFNTLRKIFITIGITSKTDLSGILTLKNTVKCPVAETNPSGNLPFDCLDKICIDAANGYIPKVLEMTRDIRNMFSGCLIMVGNVATPDVVYDLIDAGADIVRAGIGNGSVCLSRRMTGVGRPQLSTIIDCADAAHACGGMICSDGGATCPGDIVKAFAAGADFVMSGSMFAGCEESDGTKISVDTPSGGKSFRKSYYGMSSALAQKVHFGGIRPYRASEGRELTVPYTGAAADTMHEIEGGIRSAMTYIGAERLKDIPKCATFYRVNRQLNEYWSKNDK
jgi:GMP reductase